MKARVPPPAALGAFERLSTARLRPEERLARWAAWHPSLTLNPLGADGGRSLDAEVVRHASPDGCVFGYTKSGHLECRFGERNRGDYVLFTAPMRGEGRAVAGRSVWDLRADSDCYLIDGRRRLTFQSNDRFAHLHLVIPRSVWQRSLSNDPFTGRETVKVMPRDGILAIAVSTLSALIDAADRLDRVELSTATRSILRMVLLGTERALAKARGTPAALDADALLLGARRLMESVNGPQRMTAAEIAAALGCSRAHLYRVFAAHGRSVAQTQREVSLRHARELLDESRPRSLEQIARESGFASLSSFFRAFRAHVGMTPGEYRDHSRSAGTRPARTPETF